MVGHGTHGQVKIFSGNSNKSLAKKIADKLGLPLGNMEVGRFSDGEVSINIQETVRGCDVFLIQSTSTPVNENLMELLVMIDAVRRASASRITAVIPYFGYARQDRKARARDPISAKLVANLLEKAGADRILTMDLHSSQVQGFFDIPVDNLYGMPVLAKYFMRQGFKNEDLVVVSPDVGSVARSRLMAAKFNANLAIVDKDRPEDYLLGVMIEGERGTNYHLVDKLQIQPQVLKSLGWKTIRVYALDWINSPTSVVTEIEIAYKKSLDAKRSRSYKGVYEKGAMETPPFRAPILQEGKKRTSKGKDYLVPAYSTIPSSKMDRKTILEQIGIVLLSEAPISERLLQKRITKIFGLTRLANKNKEEYDLAIEEALKTYPTTRNKDLTLFFWNIDADPKRLSFYRKRSGNSERAINDIAKEEIAVAIYDVLMDQFGLDKEGLARQLLSYFSMSRDTGKYKDIIDEAIDWAINNRTDFLTTGENGALLLKS